MQKSNVQHRTIIGNTTSQILFFFCVLVFLFIYYINIIFVFDGFLFKTRRIIYLSVFSLYRKLNVLEAILYKWHARIHLHIHTQKEIYNLLFGCSYNDTFIPYTFFIHIFVFMCFLLFIFFIIVCFIHFWLLHNIDFFFISIHLILCSVVISVVVVCFFSICHNEVNYGNLYE